MKIQIGIKFFIFALVLTFLFVLVSCFSSTEVTEFEIDSNGTLIKYNGLGGSVIIPENITAIGFDAFAGCANVTSITVPNGVTEIGNYAFYNCMSLTSITLPNSVTNIGSYAFSGCANLTNMTIPDNIVSIGIGAFEDCRNLTSVTMPNSIAEISSYSFAGCVNLTDISIPSSVTNIGSYAFYNCKNLTNVTLSNSITSINKWAFAACPNLTGVVIPKSVSEIESYAFYNITNLTLYGATGSYVETYAAEHNISFSASIPSDYLYEITGIGEKITLPVGELIAVTDEASAVIAITTAIARLSSEQKLSATGVDLITLYAEEAVAQAASLTIEGSNILIDELGVRHLQLQAEQVKATAEKVLASFGITTVRNMRTNIKFMPEKSERITITIEPSARNITVDNIKVETPNYSVSFPHELFERELNDGNLVVTIEEMTLPLIEIPEAALPLSEYPIGESSTNTNSLYSPKISTAYIKGYKITINKDISQNCTFSFKPVSNVNLDYQVVMNIGQDGKDTVIVSKYNPITGMIDAKLNKSGSYLVQENRKSFDDLADNVGEAKEVIEKLASKGIINGISDTVFSPDSPVTRAELTALIMRVLSKVDDSTANNFTDVYKDMWYFTAINSAKEYGIVNGTSDTIFEPDSVIRKDQIVAVIARTLRSEMNYKNNTANKSKYLQNFTDKDELEEAYIEDISFAEREGLIVARKDGKFNSAENITRMDAAMLLDRLFERLW